MHSCYTGYYYPVFDQKAKLDVVAVRVTDTEVIGPRMTQTAESEHRHTPSSAAAAHWWHHGRSTGKPTRFWYLRCTLKMLDYIIKFKHDKTF